MPITEPTKRREYLQKRRKRMVSEGKCSCGRERLTGFTRCRSCVETTRESTRRRNARRRKPGVCRHCGKDSGKKAKCKSCQTVAANYLRRLKIEVITAYGGKCACCGVAELAFLTIDHIKGGGGRHRRMIGNLYRWLKRHGFPKGDFQCLCFNCNCGRKVNGGICPHKSASS